MAAWDRGRVVLHRHFQGARLGLLKTAFVLADDERGLRLWVPLGAPMLDRRAVDGRGLRAMPFSQWLRTDTKLWEVTWRGPGVLKFLPPGQNHSVWLFRSGDGRFTGYYVNLEEAGVRWDDGDIAGVDIVDQDLDIWAPAGPAAQPARAARGGGRTRRSSRSGSPSPTTGYAMSKPYGPRANG